MSKLVELVGRGKLSVTSASDLANSVAALFDLVLMLGVSTSKQIL